MSNSQFIQPTPEQLEEFWSQVAKPRESKIEFNYKEKAVTIGLINDGGKTVFIEDEAWNSKVYPALSGFWHDEGRDELEYLILYNDDTFFCQKKRLKYDFSSKSSYWTTYEFKECAIEQVKQICDLLETVAVIQKEVETNKILEEVRQLNSLDYYYDAKWYKKKDEINKMLLFSDWRILPDSPQKFEGEKELWVIWRQRLRTLLPDNPRETFQTNFEMFKFITTLKYPIDPRVYFDKYPNREVEYLSTEDQFAKYDFEVSKDFVSTTMLNLVNFMEIYNEKIIPIERKILDLAKQLKLEEVYSNLDYTKFTPIE